MTAADEAELAALEQDAAIGRRETAARVSSVGDDLAHGELAGERLALRFEIDSDGEALEIAASGIGTAKLGDERCEVARRLGRGRRDLRALGLIVAVPAVLAYNKLSGDIGRYGHAYSPMDETLARVALDISGRPFLVWKAHFTQEKLGEWDTELIEHWFHSVAQSAGITLHVQLLYGQNNHHVCEAIYKGFARAMRAAVELDSRKGRAIPSTKGQLGG